MLYQEKVRDGYGTQTSVTRYMGSVHYHTTYTIIIQYTNIVSIVLKFNVQELDIGKTVCKQNWENEFSK